MKIFDLFRSKPASSEQQHTPVDKRKAECPYCGQQLNKIPGSKTKCPHCSNFMYVRTRPKDNARVVVTKEEAEIIEEDWSIVAGAHDVFLVEKEKLSKEKEYLKKKFGGKEPSENDVQWSLLNKQLLEHASNGDRGLYRNALFAMGEILRKEMRFKESLKKYFEVCYLDLCGANNTGGIKDPEILKKFPPFNPKELAFLALAIVYLMRRILRKLQLTDSEVRELFIEHNSHIENALKLPIRTEACW
jgi:hypothetical protein